MGNIIDGIIKRIDDLEADDFIEINPAKMKWRHVPVTLICGGGLTIILAGVGTVLVLGSSMAASDNIFMLPLAVPGALAGSGLVLGAVASAIGTVGVTTLYLARKIMEILRPYINKMNENKRKENRANGTTVQKLENKKAKKDVFICSYIKDNQKLDDEIAKLETAKSKIENTLVLLENQKAEINDEIRNVLEMQKVDIELGMKDRSKSVASVGKTAAALKGFESRKKVVESGIAQVSDEKFEVESRIKGLQIDKAENIAAIQRVEAQKAAIDAEIVKTLELRKTEIDLDIGKLAAVKNNMQPSH